MSRHVNTRSCDLHRIHVEAFLVCGNRNERRDVRCKKRARLDRSGNLWNSFAIAVGGRAHIAKAAQAQTFVALRSLPQRRVVHRATGAIRRFAGPDTELCAIESTRSCSTGCSRGRRGRAVLSHPASDRGGRRRCARDSRAAPQRIAGAAGRETATRVTKLSSAVSPAVNGITWPPYKQNLVLRAG